MEIARPLLEYLRMKQAAEWLGQLERLGTTTFVHKKRETPAPSPPREDLPMEADLMDLVNAFKDVLAGHYQAHTVDFSTEKLSVHDRMAEIARRLTQKSSILFTELFHPRESKPELVVTFLAILEMAKQGDLRIMQHVQSGIIRIFAPAHLHPSIGQI